MKETYYLKHDYNSRNDEKVLNLRAKYGAEGFGIYWMLLEKLAESSEGRLLLTDIPAIAYEIHDGYERITDVIQSYNLFEISEKHFWSARLMQDLAERNEKSKKASLAIKVRWATHTRKKAHEKAHKNTDVIQGEERRGEERKEEEINACLFFGEKQSVSMLAHEYKKLCQRFGGKCADCWIQDLENWKLGKGKKTKDDYLTILSWISRAKKEGRFKLNPDDFREEDFATKAEYEQVLNRFQP